MRKSILETLFYGELRPQERTVIKSLEEIELEYKIEIAKKYFTEKMSEEDCKHLQDLEDLYIQEVNFTEVNIFSYGFSLGALMMIETLGKEGVINE